MENQATGDRWIGAKSTIDQQGKQPLKYKRICPVAKGHLSFPFVFVYIWG